MINIGVKSCFAGLPPFLDVPPFLGKNFLPPLFNQFSRCSTEVKVKEVAVIMTLEQLKCFIISLGLFQNF